MTRTRRQLVAQAKLSCDVSFVAAKMVQMRKRLKDHAAQGGTCPSCHQILREGWPNHSMAELVAGGLVDLAELGAD